MSATSKIAPSILLLDDDPLALEEAQEILELESLAAITAPDVEAAMGYLEAYPEISLIVTDMHLVGTDGSVSLGVNFAM